MMKVLGVVAALLMLSACTATERGAATGAAIGGLGGALIDGGRGAVIGAAGGAVAGALIGRSQERSGYCIYRDRRGRTYEAPCD
ncbi:MAG: YMGG-like glycine zipper-containing protein [Ahrensia sp.]|nr:YMGG-like glycine zipper-containing protein [Ahrensia sp.]